MKIFASLVLTITAVLFITGFAYYLFAPYNWGAGEIILHVHLWIGAIYFAYVIFAIANHVKTHYRGCANSNAFKMRSYALLLFYLFALISGFTHFIPYISYFFKPIYYEFETYDMLSNIHLYASILAIIFLATHILFKPKELTNEIN